MPTTKKTTTKKVVKKQTTEDLVMGKAPEVIEEKVINYEAPERLYKITNLEVNNKPVIVTGDVVETFIGCKNTEARKALINGAKEVITKDAYKNTAKFKIEVVK